MLLSDICDHSLLVLNESWLLYDVQKLEHFLLHAFGQTDDDQYVQYDHWQSVKMLHVTFCTRAHPYLKKTSLEEANAKVVRKGMCESARSLSIESHTQCVRVGSPACSSIKSIWNWLWENMNAMSTVAQHTANSENVQIDKTNSKLRKHLHPHNTKSDGHACFVPVSDSQSYWCGKWAKI